MAENTLTFRFSGQALLATRTPNDTFSQEDFYLSKNLNVERWAISDEIRYGLSHALGERGVEITDVHIHFYVGTVNWEGMITILDWGARIAGNIALLLYIRSLIKGVCNNILAQRLPLQDLRKINTEVELPIEAEERPISSGVWEFSVRKILFVVTALNLVILFCGIFMASVYVPGILEKYSEAKMKLNEASELFHSKEQAFQSKLATLDTEIARLTNQKDQLSKELDTVQNEKRNLDKKVRSLNSDAKKFKERFENFRTAKAPISLRSLWILSSWPVRSLMCLMGACTLGLLAMLGYIIPTTRSR
jgi:FtsZ-binding cell division protein ZapB